MTNITYLECNTLLRQSYQDMQNNQYLKCITNITKIIQRVNCIKSDRAKHFKIECKTILENLETICINSELQRKNMRLIKSVLSSIK